MKGRIKLQRRMQRKRTQDIRIGTWNARTLNRPGALQEMKEEMVKYEIDILAIQETRWPSEGILCQRDATFYYTKSKQEMYGVAFVVNKRTQEEIIDFKPINERICIIRYKTNFYKVTLINVHGPTEDKDELEKEDFYRKLHNVIDKIPNHDMKIILGDFNGKICKEELYIPTIEKHSVHDRSNDNGMRVIDLAATKNLVVRSKQFSHKRIQKISWQSPDGYTENQINHVLIDRRHASTITDIRSQY
jgi:exonuclease III